MLPKFRDAFVTRWSATRQPPEFFQVGIPFFYDLYRQDVWQYTNPLRTPLIDALATGATEGDLDALEDLLVSPYDNKTRAYARYFQGQLIETAMEKSRKGQPCSAAVPRWFRAKGWGLKELWACEAPPVYAVPEAPAPAPAVKEDPAPAAKDPTKEELTAILKELEELRAKVAALEKSAAAHLN